NPAAGPRPAPRRAGGLSLRRIGGDLFELVHPRCVREMEPDYEEGMEILRAGDPEGARDALRYALHGCGDNLWVHVAPGPMAVAPARAGRGPLRLRFRAAVRGDPPRVPRTARPRAAGDPAVLPGDRGSRGVLRGAGQALRGRPAPRPLEAPPRRPPAARRGPG